MCVLLGEHGCVLVLPFGDICLPSSHLLSILFLPPKEGQTGWLCRGSHGGSYELMWGDEHPEPLGKAVGRGPQTCCSLCIRLRGSECDGFSPFLPQCYTMDMLTEKDSWLTHHHMSIAVGMSNASCSSPSKVAWVNGAELISNTPLISTLRRNSWEYGNTL